MLDSAMKSEYQRGNWVVAGGTGHKKLKNCPTMLFEDLQFPSRNITFVKNDTIMPTLSMFFGIIIRMYFAPKEHNPPHIHVYYQDLKSIIDINTCEILEGQIPSRQLRLVLAWIEIHNEELLANWKLCQNGEKPFAIEPLK